MSHQNFKFHSPLHKTAHLNAMQGIRVFPCISNAQGLELPPKQRKKPACKHGHLERTCDPVIIYNWWKENPDYNIGRCPADQGVVIVDPEAEGLEDWERLLLENCTSGDTYTVGTPNGGKHYYYFGTLDQHTQIRAFDKDIAIDVFSDDTRYVLIPPSVIGGNPYKVVNNAEIADLPDWINTKTRKTSASPVERTIDVTYDLESNVEAAIARLQDCAARGDVAKAKRCGGGNGDQRIYDMGCNMRELGISFDKALALALEHWYPHCVPNDKPGFVRFKFTNAYAYAQNSPGVFAATSSEVFQPALEQLDLKPEGSPQPRSPFYPRDDEEMDTIPPSEWILPGFIQKQTKVLVYGQSGALKSFLALDMSLGIATGRETCGVTPNITGPVFYGALEGMYDIMRKRRSAWRTLNGIEGKTQFYVMPAPRLRDARQTIEFAEQIRLRCEGRRPALIVLDTVSKMMAGMDPTRDVPLFVEFCDNLIAMFGCSVIAIHHSGHDANKGPRDSSAWYGDMDTVMAVEKVEDEKNFIQMRVTKHKDEEFDEDKPFIFEKHKLAGSLVLKHSTVKLLPPPTSKADDPCSSQNVAAALKKLGAIHFANGVSTDVLADELLPRLIEEDPEDRKGRVRQRAGHLKRAKDSLKGYMTKNGPVITWHLVPE